MKTPNNTVTIKIELKPVKTIYLISDTGAAKTNQEIAAAIMEQGGYRRVTKKEYGAQLRKMRREDETAAREAHRVIRQDGK